MTPDDVTPVTGPLMTRRTLLIGGGVVGVIFAAILFLLLPAVCRVREAASRMKDSSNLKMLAIVQHTYADYHEGYLIGPYSPDLTGVMNTQMSLRVGLLPYMEGHDIFRRIDLGQPWDSVHNAPATSVVIRNLQSPDTPDKSKPDTPYRVFYGGGALFEADGKPVKLFDTPDGTSNTILFVHATETVPWAKPQEFAYTPTTALPPLGSPGVGRGGFSAAMADGSVRFLRHTIPEADLRSLIEKADGRGADIE